MRQRILRIFTTVILLVVACFAGTTTALADTGTVTFGSEFYEYDETFPIGVYITGDEAIGTYYVEVSYDNRRMKYLRGAEGEENGIITLKGTATGDTVKYLLYFEPLSGGEANIQVDRAMVMTAGSNNQAEFTITTLGSAPIYIGGEDIVGETTNPEDTQGETDSNENVGTVLDVPVDETLENPDADTDESADAEESNNKGLLGGIKIIIFTILVIAIVLVVLVILFKIAVRIKRRRRRKRKRQQAARKAATQRRESAKVTASNKSASNKKSKSYLGRFCTDVKRYFEYTKYAARAELKAEVADSYLNWIWWILEPLCFMIIYSIIFTMLFDGRTAYFNIYIFVGLTMWNFFQNNVQASVRLVKNNKQVIKRVPLPKVILIIRKMLVNEFKMLVSFIVVVVMMIGYQVPISLQILWVIPLLVLLNIITFAFMSICLHVGVFIDDLDKIVKILLRMLFYMTGIFYSIEERVPAPWNNIFLKYNPMASVVNSFRKAVLYQSQPDIMDILGWLILAVIVSIIGIYLIYKNENNYVKVV